MKEIKFTPNTQLYDIKHKIKKVPSWIEDDEKVKLSVKFSGREIAHPETGQELLSSVIELLPMVKIEKNFSLDGKTMSVVLSKKKLITTK